MAIAEHLSQYAKINSGRLNNVLSAAEIGQDGYFKDHQSPIAYTAFFDFSEGQRVTFVEASKYKVGSPDQRFTTGFIRACSGLLLKNPSHTAFGLHHASPLPFIDLTDNDFVELEIFRGGQVKEIKGSESTSKDHVLSQLKHRLGITHVGTLEVQTKDFMNINRAFHIAFAPETNGLLVARNSHRDVQRFHAF